MKKTLAIILAALMCMSLTACSSGSSSSSATEAATEAAAAETAGAAAPETEAPETEAPETEAADEYSDMDHVIEMGVLVVGITDFEPMDYKDESGEWIGFDADMARAFADSLGIDVEFVEIDWDNKIFELDAGTIDCVWNGMTLTDEVTSAMECSNAYCNNAQVIIIPAEEADQYSSVEDYADLVFAVEAGSAGEAEIEALGYEYTPVKAQSDTLMEVAAGTSDAAVIDALMAAAMVGEGTSYSDLTYTIGLNSEEYGVGFRKGSDLAAALNDFFAAAYADGSMIECAETYGIQAALIEQ